MDDTVISAVYGRFSSPLQKDSSIENQVRRCKEFADSKGWKVPDQYIFYDKAISGTRIAPRDDFKRLMSLATSGKCPFQKILIDSTSRMARNTREALNIFSLVTYYNVHVYYVSQRISTEDESAEEMITIHGLIDSIYIKNLARSTHEGIEGQVLRGYSGGGKRYGYKSEPVFNGKVDIYGIPEADGYRLKIFAEQAETVLRAHKLFGEEGYSARKIIHLFNRELVETGSPVPPKGRFWSLRTLLGSPRMGHGILSNPIYNGHYYWNRRKKRRHPETGDPKFVLRNRDEWVLFNNADLKIVDDDLWEKVQKRRRLIETTTKGRYTQGKIIYSSNLFAGLLKCGHCGGNIVVVHSGKFPRYGCSNNWNKGASVCSASKQVSKREIEEAIISALGLDFETAPQLSYLEQKVNSLLIEKATVTPSWEEGAFEDQLHQTEREIGNYVQAIQFGIITDIVRDKLAEAEKKRDELKIKVEEINKKSPLSMPTVSLSELNCYLSEIRDTLSLHPLLGKTFFQNIIERINVDIAGGPWKATVTGKNDGVLSGMSLTVTAENGILYDRKLAA